MKTTLTVDVQFDPELTAPEGLASAMDRLLETALSIPDIMAEYGNPRVGEFLVAAGENQPKPQPEPDGDLMVQHRWVLYDMDADVLLTTRVYDSYQEAADDAAQANDVLVLPLVCQGVIVCPADQPVPHDSKESCHGQP